MDKTKSIRGGGALTTDNRTNEYELSYRVTSEDAELQAIEVMLTVCNGLDDLDTANRVLDYVKERMKEQ